MPDFRTLLCSALIAGTALGGVALAPRAAATSADKPAAQPTVPAPVAEEGKPVAGSDAKTSDHTPTSEKRLLPGQAAAPRPASGASAPSGNAQPATAVPAPAQGSAASAQAGTGRRPSRRLGMLNWRGVPTLRQQRTAWPVTPNRAGNLLRVA
nr:hypothetical protein [Acetobacter persici]